MVLPRLWRESINENNRQLSKLQASGLHLFLKLRIPTIQSVHVTLPQNNRQRYRSLQNTRLNRAKPET